MPTTYSDGFIYVNAFAPPPIGTPLSPFDLDIVDQDDDGFIGQGGADTINGILIDFSYPGDTVTLNVSGKGDITYDGITFYLANGDRVFTPTDGKIIEPGTFVWSSAEAGEGPVNVTLLSPPCFTAGTLIATPAGPRNVEDLVTGDTILTADGASTTVLWLGRKTCVRLSYGTAMAPVRIRAGALGRGLPTTDLTVTADHGMVFDDMVINASALVNGDTIDFVPLADLPRQITYYHIETQNHDVILANGSPTETFVDYVGRTAFDNYDDYLRMYGSERIIPEMNRIRISSRRLLPEAMRTRLGLVPTSDQLIAEAAA